MFGSWKSDDDDPVTLDGDAGTDREPSVDPGTTASSADRASADLLEATLVTIEQLINPDRAHDMLDPEEPLDVRCDRIVARLEDRLLAAPATPQLRPEDIAEANAAIQELRDISTEQASFLEEANQAADRMQGSIVENSRLAQGASEAVSELSTSTETRTSEILAVVSRLQASVDHAATSLSTIFDLGNSSNQIAKMAMTINDIAEQTNILALNAAISAARAGEHGREFGVISSEVRELANRTATTARDITRVIGELERETREAAEVMQQVDVGLEGVDQAGDSLHDIASETAQLVDAVDQISRHSKSQSAATSDVLFGIDAAVMTGEQLLEGIRNIADFVGRVTDPSSDVLQATRQDN